MRALSVASLLLLTSTTARAQVLLADDFESGQLLITDGGQWQTMGGPLPFQVLSASTSANHGASTYGLRLEDFEDGGSGVGLGRHLRYDFGAPQTGAVHAFYRMRLTRLAGIGGPWPLQLHGNVGFGTIAEFSMPTANDELRFNCGDTQFRSVPTGTLLTLDAWHRVLMSLEGLGTSTGVCTLVLDGRVIATQPMDWTGIGATAVLTGAGALELSWDGTLSVDDVAVRRGAPPPSRLHLTGPSTVFQDACSTWTLSAVQDLDGGFAPPVMELAVFISSSALVRVYEDPGCAGSFVPGLTFSPDAGSRLFGARFPSSTGAQVVIATNPGDRLDQGTRSVTILPVPDGGVPDAGVADAGIVDSGIVDAGIVDAGIVDAGFIDAGFIDAGFIDAGAPDSGGDGGAVADAGADAEHPDAGDYDIGCGCSGGALMPFALAALLLLTRAAGRSRRTRPL